MVFVVILLALIVILLAIPFDVIFKIHRQEELSSDVVVRWLFGVVQFNIPAEKERQATKKSYQPKKKKKAEKKSANSQTIKDLLWNARFRYRLFKFVKDIFKTIHIAGFYLRIRLGLDDPADTGRLWALCGPLSVFLSNLSNATVDLQPDFQTQTVYLDSYGMIRIVPLQVIFTVLAFIFSPITIRAILAVSKSNKQ